MTRNTSFRVNFPPSARMNWLQRAIALIAFAAVAVLAFFFLAAALIAGAILATIVLLRLWWLRRKLRKTGTGTYEGDYVVIENARENTRSTHP